MKLLRVEWCADVNVIVEVGQNWEFSLMKPHGLILHVEGCVSPTTISVWTVIAIIEQALISVQRELQTGSVEMIVPHHRVTSGEELLWRCTLVPARVSELKAVPGKTVVNLVRETQESINVGTVEVEGRRKLPQHPD